MHFYKIDSARRKIVINKDSCVSNILSHLCSNAWENKFDKGFDIIAVLLLSLFYIILLYYPN